ncbi:MAG: hypothetical protein K1X64_17885 [Myxococcaceae bacterium]|nr:hypothetical protein [Myxococcaceae bacterium]
MSDDSLSEEARERLTRWPLKSRRLFDELMEDAPTDLQRELLQRAVASSHTPAEVHAFADAIRAYSDGEAFDACTLDADGPQGFTVAQMLKAEGDPLFAFQLNGGSLSPREESAELKRSVSGENPLPPWAKPRKLVFDQQSSTKRARRPDARDLGASADAEPELTASRPASPGALLDDLLNEAVRPRGLTFREHVLDAEGSLTLEAALPKMVEALKKGIPLPIAMGTQKRQVRRLGMVLQVSATSSRNVFQLYDPFAPEVVWVHEQDLLGRADLPFKHQLVRRLTHVALPQWRLASF